MCSDKEPLSHFKRLQIVILHLSQKETGAKHLARNSRCHSISLVMYIFGAKFEEHCSNISEDICDSVLFKWNYYIYNVIKIPHLHNTKTWISFKQKKIFQKEKHRSSLL